MGRSVNHLKGGGVLGLRATSIVEPGGADVGMSQPLLDEGDFSLVLEGVGCGRGSQGVEAYPVDVDPGLLRVHLGHLVDPVPGDCGIQNTGAVVAHGSEEGNCRVTPTCFPPPGPAKVCA